MKNSPVYVLNVVANWNGFTLGAWDWFLKAQASTSQIMQTNKKKNQKNLKKRKKNSKNFLTVQGIQGI